MYGPMTSKTGALAPGRVLLALAMIALGVRGLYYGDFASVWQRIPIDHLPAQPFFVYATAIVELVTGLGLLMARTVRVSSAVLLVFVLLWVVLLKLPAVIGVPAMEATWLGVGEISVILAGAWTIHTLQANRRGIVAARVLFALALIPIGLAHFVYAKETAQFVPGWIPAPYAWAYITGAGSIAACLGVLFSVLPRLAANLEAAMLSIITVLVWLPGVFAAPSDASWTPFLMSSAIACGAWAVADGYRGAPWWGVGARGRGTLRQASLAQLSVA